ncbi:hypothetical protein [Maridesulfovibrio frigidus]|uniref:hypothetical protein n=1 Tax=Maridesulfovibrio frigidus TaxID=340956 RepID=UPI0004E1CC39|nr:hypothetical protein [Maridesulfovibrio frigidus]
MRLIKPTYHSVFLFVLGIISGTAFILYFTGPNGDVEAKDYLSILSSFFMLIVACIAGWINYEHLRWQKQSRLWDTSKSFFIDLLKLIDEADNYYSTLEHNILVSTGAFNDPSIQLETVPDDSFLKDFNLKLKQLKSVYSCFLPSLFRAEIESYFQKESEIEVNCNEGMYGEIDLIQEIFKRNDVLREGLLSVCKNFLGIDCR